GTTLTTIRGGRPPGTTADRTAVIGTRTLMITWMGSCVNYSQITDRLAVSGSMECGTGRMPIGTSPRHTHSFICYSQPHSLFQTIIRARNRAKMFRPSNVIFPVRIQPDSTQRTLAINCRSKAPTQSTIHGDSILQTVNTRV